MEEIIKDIMNGKELDMDELQQVTGGVQLTMTQAYSLAMNHCKTCDYPNKKTECLAYLNKVLEDFKKTGKGGTVDVNCPQGRVQL